MPIATNITLDHETHTYTDSSGVEYTSVSKILARYKEPFDRMAIAEKTALKRGCSVEQILTEWDSAAPYGTTVHEQLEHYFKRQTGKTDLITPYLWRLSQWRDQDVEFYPETILCDHELKIAGTSDLLIRRGDDWSIIDWKTNKAIYKASFGGKKLKPPLDHLDDCNFIHYSLQMSLYGLMLGEQIKKISLVHMPKGKTTIEVIPCPYLFREANAILADLCAEQNVLPF